MPNGDQKTNKEQEKQSQQISEQPPAPPENLRNLYEKKGDIKKGQTKELYVVGREALAGQIGADPDTESEIKRIDVTRDMLEQNESGEKLEWILATTLLAKFLQSGAMADDIASFEKFKSLLKGLEFKSGKSSTRLEGIKIKALTMMNGVERVVLAKIDQTTSGQPFYERLRFTWTSALEKAKKLYSEYGNTTGSGRIARWLKRNPEVAGAAGAVVAGLAALGIYKMFTGEKEEEVAAGQTTGQVEGQAAGPAQESATESKIKGKLKLGLIGLGLALVGGLLGSSKIGGWLKKNLGWDNEKTQEMLERLKSTQLDDIPNLIGDLEGAPDEEHQRLAQFVSEESTKTISAKTVKFTAKLKYKSFMSLKGVARDKALGKLAAIGDIPLIGSLLPDAEEEKELREYLRKKTDTIKELAIKEEATVLEVLTKLYDMTRSPSQTSAGNTSEGAEQGPISTPGEQPQPNQAQQLRPGDEVLNPLPPAEETVDKVPELFDKEERFNSKKLAERLKDIPQEGLKKAYNDIVVEGWKHLATEFKDRPNFQKFIDYYNQHGWEMAEKDPWKFTDNLITVCKKDGINIVTGMGKVILVHGYKYVTLTSAATIVSALWETVQAPLRDDVEWYDGIFKYVEGSVPFMVICGSTALAKSLMSSVTRNGTEPNAFRAMLRGAGRGALFPFEVARLHIAGAQYLYRTGREAQFNIQTRLTSATLKQEVMRNHAKFHAETASKYEELYQGSIGRKGALPRRALSWLTKERIDALAVKHLKKYIKIHNTLHQNDIIDVNWRNETSIDKARAKMKQFLDGELAKELVKTTRVKENFFKGPDGKLKSVAEMRQEANSLKKEITALADGDPIKAIKQNQLQAIENFVDSGKAIKFNIDGTELAKLDDLGKARKLEQLAREMQTIEQGLQARINHEVEKIAAEAKLNKIPLDDARVIAKLEQVDQAILIPFAQKKQLNVQLLNEHFKKLPRELKTKTLAREIKYAIDGVENTHLTRFVKGAKGRAKMMVLMATLMFATDQIIHRNETARDFDAWWAEMGPEAGQLLLDTLPLTGFISNYYSAWSGREVVTKRDVSSTWDRASNVIWGTVGLAGDVLSVIAAAPSVGASLAANASSRLAILSGKGSVAASRLLKSWPRIARLADRMGGWLEFGKKLAKYVRTDSALLAKSLRKIERVGMVAGTVMLGGGLIYNLRYAFADSQTEIELDPMILNPETLPEAMAETTMTTGP